MPADGERVAVNEQAIRDLRDAIHDIRETARSDHHRLREVEAAVSLMVQERKGARRAEEHRQRRIEMYLQWLAVAVGLGGLLMTAALVFAAFYFHR